jgi:aryl-alcohol dehydrogenase-like predicted oxidoreductase
MQYGTIPGINKPVSRLAQGLAGLTTQNTDFWFPVMDAVWEQGCTMFDAAHGYGNGECERGFGRWIHSRGVKDKLAVLTKGAHHNADRRRVTPFDITADLHDSLVRLKLDYIDLYILHRDDENMPVGPIVEALNQHQRAGKIGAFGGSNWSHRRIQEANDYAQDNGLTPFVISSPNFSLAEQIKPPWDNCISISGPSNQTARDYYRQTQFPLLTWSSLAGGFFSGRFQRHNLDSFSEYLDKLCVECYCNEANFQRLERTQQLAAQKDVPITAIAMAYIFNHGLNLFGLTQARSGAEFAETLRASELKLTPHEMAWLNLEA